MEEGTDCIRIRIIYKARLSFSFLLQYIPKVSIRRYHISFPLCSLSYGNGYSDGVTKYSNVGYWSWT